MTKQLEMLAMVGKIKNRNDMLWTDETVEWRNELHQGIETLCNELENKIKEG